MVRRAATLWDHRKEMPRLRNGCALPSGETGYVRALRAVQAAKGRWQGDPTPQHFDTAERSLEARGDSEAAEWVKKVLRSRE